MGEKLSFLKRAELVESLKANGLPHSGRKAQLVERLRTWIEGDMCRAQLKDLERLRQQRTYQQATSDKTYSFGLNDRGQLGQGDLINRQDPHEISSLTGIGIVRITVGFDSDCAFAINNDGIVRGE